MPPRAAPGRDGAGGTREGRGAGGGGGGGGKGGGGPNLCGCRPPAARAACQSVRPGRAAGPGRGQRGGGPGRARELLAPYPALAMIRFAFREASHQSHSLSLSLLRVLVRVIAEAQPCRPARSPLPLPLLSLSLSLSLPPTPSHLSFSLSSVSSLSFFHRLAPLRQLHVGSPASRCVGGVRWRRGPGIWLHTSFVAAGVCVCVCARARVLASVCLCVCVFVSVHFSIPSYLPLSPLPPKLSLSLSLD